MPNYSSSANQVVPPTLVGQSMRCTIFCIQRLWFESYMKNLYSTQIWITTCFFPHFSNIAKEWLEAVTKVLWHEEVGVWLDYDISNDRSGGPRIAKTSFKETKLQNVQPSFVKQSSILHFFFFFKYLRVLEVVPILCYLLIISI